MFIALFIIVNTGTIKCLTTKYWINKFVYLLSLGQYLALKRNKLIHVPTWRNLKSTKLNEIKADSKDSTV